MDCTHVDKVGRCTHVVQTPGFERAHSLSMACTSVGQQTEKPGAVCAAASVRHVCEQMQRPSG